MQNYRIFIGTYTERGGSEGIYQCFLNEDGIPESVTSVKSTENPTFLCTSEDGGRLFEACEMPGYAKITAYSIKEKYPVKLWDYKLEGHDLLCHLACSGLNHMLLGACYGEGGFFAVRTHPDDDSKPPVSVSCFTDISPFLCSHPHSFVPDNRQKFAVAVDLGLDRLTVYELPAGRRACAVNLPTAEGPRCFAFHPKLDVGYVITEYSNRIYIFDYQKETGMLRLRESVSTIPDNYCGITYGSDIVITPDGKNLYAGNRGADTIVHFAIREDGSLARLSGFDCGGRWPRHFSLTADGNFMLVANERSHNVSVFRIDPGTGEAVSQTGTIPVSSPSFVFEANL